MIQRLGALFLVLSLATAGCIGSDGPESGAPQGQTAVEDLAASLPAEAPGEGERGLGEPPVLRLGEWWNVSLTSDLYGVDTEVTLVVAGIDDGRYMVGMPTGGFVHEALILHLPGVGPVHRSSLGYETHGDLYEPLHFPLEPGQTWGTAWFDGQLDGEVVEAGNGTAQVELVGSNTQMDVTYDAGKGFPTRIDVPGYASYEVTDHGYGFTGNVTVPWNHDLLFLNGRIGPVVNFSQAPAPPVESVDVDGSYEGASVALILGNAIVEGPPGVYRASAIPPNGSALEATFVPQPAGSQLALDAHGIDGPVGTWDLEFEAGGPGIAMVEAMGYEVREIDIG